MYTRFFGLSQIPFSIAPDPRYLFMSERHREALAHLLYGLNGGGGFVLLTGEIGAGKTTVCRLFLEKVPARCNVAYVFNPKQTVIELLQTICDEFGVPVARAPDGSTTVKDYIDPLNAFLLASHAAKQNNVLIIDEAQNLSADVLEQLRLLTNLETNERKLLQILLIGQPELRAMLARPELEQLAQRVIARFHLDALSADETGKYIAHRLAIGGITGALPFDARMMRRIHARTGGVPRRINLLCDRALLGAFAAGRREVDARILDRAAREVFDLDTQPTISARLLQPRVLLGSFVLLAAAFVGGMAVQGGLPFQQAAAGKPVPAAAVAAGAQTPSKNDPAGQVSPAAAATMTVTATTAATATAPSAPIASVPTAPVARAATPAAAAVPEPTAAPLVLGNDVRDQRAAYRHLARLWNLQVRGEDLCQEAAKQQLYCFVGTRGLTEIRQIDRPGILALHDDDDRPYYALLFGLSNDRASLRIGDVTEVVTLEALARRWNGQFMTFWRGPPGFRAQPERGEQGPAVDWLAAKLAALEGKGAPAAGVAFDDALRAHVRRFQLAQGLLPDGLAGPQTFMRLASLSGAVEPKLQSDANPVPPSSGIAAHPAIPPVVAKGQ